MFTHTDRPLATTQAGHGPLVILTHGVTDSSASLSDLIRHLAARFRVVAIDMPGHGLSEPSDTEVAIMDATVEALRTTIDPLVQRFGPAVGLGHSMGGAALLKLASQHPEFFTGVIAEDPALLSPTQAAAYATGGQALAQHLESVRHDLAAELAANQAEYASWPNEERPGWLAGKEQVDLGLVKRGEVGYTDWAGWLPDLSVDAMIVSSDGQDVLLGQAGLDRIEALGNPHITTALLPGARHCIRRENTAAFYDLIDPMMTAWAGVEEPLPPEQARQFLPPSETAKNYFIDPTLQEVLNAPYFPDWDLAGMRARSEKNYGGPPPEVEGATLNIEYAEGQAGPVEVRFWTPDAAPTCVIMAIHGGGFVMGAARYDDPHNAEMAVAYQAVVTSPEYRLAPEHPFPAGADDCLQAALLCRKKAQELGVPFFIYGDSGGSGIAEPVACWLLDRDSSADGVILLEPFIDPSLTSVSMRRHATAQMWNQTKSRAAWGVYLAGQDPQVLPRLTRYGHRCDKPRVLTVVASADALRDEGIRWATDLVDAGFDSELLMPAGTYHAGLSMANTAPWDHVRDTIARFLTKPAAPTPSHEEV